MSVLRRICGMTRRDRRRNVDVKQELGVKLDIVQRLQRRRLTYFGHVARMNNSRYPNMDMEVDSDQEEDRRKSGLTTSRRIALKYG